MKLLSFASTFLIAGLIGGVIIFFLLFLWYAKDLPSPETVKRKEGYSTVVLDRNNKPVYDIYTDKNRIAIPFSDIPDFLKKATIAIEDKDFYKHQGFDQKGILRSVFNTLTFQGIQGGSTLTQQLVKNVLLSSERTFTRKIKEFMLAVQIERKYSKDEILQMYLNESPYGGTMWGIESASLGYFGKHAKELTQPEAVILAGLPQRPSYYSPFSATDKAYLPRAEEVLRRMREDGYINPKEEYDLKKNLAEVKFASPGAQFQAVHFVFYIKKQLVEKFGEKLVDEGGLRVTTTLDLPLQEKVESIVDEELGKLKSLDVSNGAAMVINPQNGEILTYVGSRQYSSDDPEFQGKFDVVSMGFRQPGSTLKPITYAAAFTKGYTPASLLMDVETKFPGGENRPDYVPKNYDGKFRGPVQIRFALANSINIPAVKMTALVGIKNILETAYEMGMSTLQPTDDNVSRLGLSLTLGGGEVRLLDLVPAFGVFAAAGIKNDLVSILKVTDGNGKVLYEAKKTSGRRVLPEDVSFLISDILSDNNSRKDVFGPNSYLYVPGRTVAVKTGTTDDKKDNWAVGYTPSFAVGVWVGNNDNTPMNPKLASGATGAAPIWNRIIQEALRASKDEPFKKPDDIVSVSVDSYSGGLPYKDKPTRNEYFIKGTEPAETSPIYKKIKLSKSDNNKLANLIEIATGSYDEKEYIVFTEDDPTSRDEKNRWQEGIDEWIGKQGDPVYHPPKDTSNKDENNVVVKIKTPQDKTKIDDNNVRVEAEGKSTKDIKKMEIYIDDVLKTTTENNYLDETIVLETGIRNIKVKAYNSDNNSGEAEISIGVKTSWEPTNTPAPTPTVTPLPSPTVTISPTPNP